MSSTGGSEDKIINDLVRLKHILINAFVLSSCVLAILAVTVVEATAVYNIFHAVVKAHDVTPTGPHGAGPAGSSSSGECASEPRTK